MSQQALSDRAAIADAVANWGLWRDTGRWELLRSLYTPDAIMHTTWFVGPATEFIDRSIEAAKRAGARGQHFVGASSIELSGDRAIAETRMVLLLRAPLHGVEVDVTCYCRAYDRFVRYEGAWRIQVRDNIYEKDRLDPVDPSASVRLDPAELARHPYGYRHLAYVQGSGGARVTPDLPVPGSEALARLYADAARWLQLSR
jgi:hypothetical protein